MYIDPPSLLFFSSLRPFVRLRRLIIHHADHAVAPLKANNRALLTEIDALRSQIARNGTAEAGVFCVFVCLESPINVEKR
jgi:hypothetical protein